MAMRLYEFADAEAQLALLRTIIDNTWTAIAQQAEQQKRVDAERKAQAKFKPRSKKSSKGTSIRIPTPPPTPTKKPQAPLANQPTPPLNKPNPNALKAVKPVAPTNSQLKQHSINTETNPKLTSTPYPKPTANTLIKPSNGLKMGYLGKNIGTTEKEDDGDDRHSKNGIANLKK
jgi:hypothetical protein